MWTNFRNRAAKVSWLLEAINFNNYVGTFDGPLDLLETNLFYIAFEIRSLVNGSALQSISPFY